MYEALPGGLSTAFERVGNTRNDLETSRALHTQACHDAAQLAEEMLDDQHWFCYRVPGTTLNLVAPGGSTTYAVPAEPEHVVVGVLSFPDTPNRKHVAELKPYTPNGKSRSASPIQPKTRKVRAALFGALENQLGVVDPEAARELLANGLILFPDELYMRFTMASLALATKR